MNQGFSTSSCRDSCSFLAGKETIIVTPYSWRYQPIVSGVTMTISPDNMYGNFIVTSLPTVRRGRTWCTSLQIEETGS